MGALELFIWTAITFTGSVYGLKAIVGEDPDKTQIESNQSKVQKIKNVSVKTL